MRLPLGLTASIRPLSFKSAAGAAPGASSWAQLIARICKVDPIRCGRSMHRDARLIKPERTFGLRSEFDPTRREPSAAATPTQFRTTAKTPPKSPPDRLARRHVPAVATASTARPKKCPSPCKPVNQARPLTAPIRRSLWPKGGFRISIRGLNRVSRGLSSVAHRRGSSPRKTLWKTDVLTPCYLKYEPLPVCKVRGADCCSRKRTNTSENSHIF